jgi:hypothetical protein
MVFIHCRLGKNGLNITKRLHFYGRRLQSVAFWYKLQADIYANLETSKPKA